MIEGLSLIIIIFYLSFIFIFTLDTIFPPPKMSLKKSLKKKEIFKQLLIASFFMWFMAILFPLLLGEYLSQKIMR